MASTMLLAATVWMIVADYRRPWRKYQASRPEPGIQEIALAGLPLEDHGAETKRCDRCITCHIGDCADVLTGDCRPPTSSPPAAHQPSPAPPYAPHPRPELFVGPESPHPAGEFGCTICHDGRGRATDFTLAGHTPSSPSTARAWQAEHGWRHDVAARPMLPARLAEGRCAGCHHQIEAFSSEVLEADSRNLAPWTQPLPGAKLLEGFQVVRQLGCFGCHEIKGLDASGRTVGPDLQLEAGADDALGRMRRVGPSLRHVAERLDAPALVDRILNPRAFLPRGRMPRLFGLDDHLVGKSLERSKRFEKAEARAIAAALMVDQPVALAKGSGPYFRPTSSPEDTVGWPKNGPDPERGQKRFEQGGCLACHVHRDFPGIESTLGPELSDVGSKYTGPAAAAWLLGWLRNPFDENARTRMPKPHWELTGDDSNDPAADVVAYLLSSTSEGTQAGNRRGQSHFRFTKIGTVPSTNIGTVPNTGIGTVPLPVDADALGLLADEYGVGRDSKDLAVDVGRAAIHRRGCTGCHEMPLDDGPKIGPELTRFGQKRSADLAFERIDEYLATHPSSDDVDGYYTQAVAFRRPEGFAWQKLSAPRAMDFRMADGKRYRDGLKMGRFDLEPAEREAVVTFLMSLIGRRPAERYVPMLDARRQALVVGRRLIDEFGCQQCHVFEMERWRWAPKPGSAHVDVVGMPRVDGRGPWLEDEDDDGQPIHYFTLWQPATIDGQTWPVGGSDLVVSPKSIAARRPARGGDVARWLYPRVQDKTQPEAWGWLPPPLAGEGAKVRPEWLYRYLRSPTPIRLAAVMRMPQFNLSSEEATALVAYFAAAADVAFPYAPSDDSTRPEEIDPRAMNILVDSTTFCAKCHRIGDDGPAGAARATMAPDLLEVQDRLQPDYVRRWLGNPRSVLPYTAMPVNFPPEGEPLGQDLFPATSAAQLDAVAELLLHYDRVLRTKEQR